MATLEGQTIVVFGGSSGIGYSVAKVALLSRAAHVVIASSTQMRIDAAVASLQSEVIGGNGLPGKVSGFVVDAKVSNQVEEFMARVGEIDHLVWCSGDMTPGGQASVAFDAVDLGKNKREFNRRER